MHIHKFAAKTTAILSDVTSGHLVQHTTGFLLKVKSKPKGVGYGAMNNSCYLRKRSSFTECDFKSNMQPKNI